MVNVTYITFWFRIFMLPELKKKFQEIPSIHFFCFSGVSQVPSHKSRMASSLDVSWRSPGPDVLLCKTGSLGDGGFL